MRTLFCTLIMSMVSVFTFAQTEPDFEMEPYVFNQADSTFATPLPCESAYVKAKAGASLFLTGIGKVKTYYYIKGVKSSLEIIKLETLDTKRRWKTGEAGSFTGASSNEDNSVVLKYKKYGENSVIVSTAALEPGEYCLAITNMMTNSKSAKVYTFRIK